MFEFLFNYPSSVFAKGEWVLLGGWPKWVLALLVVAAAAGLAVLIRSRLPQVAPSLRNWRTWVIWLLQSSLAAVILILLWQPAIMVAELKPQQNIIAVLVDDSRSMGITEDGSSRDAKALQALQNGVLDSLQKKFQTRLYRVDERATRVANLQELQAATAAPAPVTRIGDSLKQLVDETADLPIGAVVVLSDGDDNSGGVGLDAISALRNRRIPVHTVGFGDFQTPSDVEINDAIVAGRALANSRLAATVSFRQHGYAGQKATVRVSDGDKVLAAHEIVFGPDNAIQTENLLFNAGAAGARTFDFSIDPRPGELNRLNNSVSRLVSVNSEKRRILYVEGEPRWQYKFMRRAEEDDPIVQVASMLRTSENKIYRQGITDPKELADGFPAKVEDLFTYQALIIGSMEASYFTPDQQDLIKQFVDRRGGGVLFLAGKSSLSDGGWGASTLADLLPVTLPNHKGTFHRDEATAELTPAGADSIIGRLVEDPAKNIDRWKKLPYMVDYQEIGDPKPGAAVLANVKAGSRTLPLLVTENYGRGRTAVFASSGTWRWKMQQPLEDQTHDQFWQQLLRWVAADTPGRVVASMPSNMLFDNGRVQLSADVRDKNYQPLGDARVQAHFQGPGGTAALVDMTPDPNTPGLFHAEWTADKPGSYSADVVAQQGQDEAGTDTLTFARVDGVAENFHTEQNRELLQQLAAQTGGRYWQPSELSKLADEIPYSDAGITVREAKSLWNMPAVFLVLLLLPCCEWLLRRKWGIV
jgi:uncharacterized membrane protein